MPTCYLSAENWIVKEKRGTARVYMVQVQIQDSELWDTIDLSGDQEAGTKLASALCHPQYKLHLRSVRLEFAANVEDAEVLPLCNFELTSLNLNGCQR